MSLHKPDIPPEIINELYGRNLVLTEDFRPGGHSFPPPTEMRPAAVAETVPPVKKKGDASIIEYLGGNARNIVWLVNDPVNKYTGDAEFNLLTGILNACKMSMNDVAIVNHHGNSFSFEEMYEQLQPAVIIALGNDTGFLPAESSPFTRSDINGVTVISGTGLATMLGDREAKAKLWQMLKTQFNV